MLIPQVAQGGSQLPAQGLLRTACSAVELTPLLPVLVLDTASSPVACLHSVLTFNRHNQNVMTSCRHPGCDASNLHFSLGLPGHRAIYQSPSPPLSVPKLATVSLSSALFPRSRLCSLNSVPGRSLLCEPVPLITDTGTI